MDADDCFSPSPPMRRRPLTRNPRVARADFDLSPQAGRGKKASAPTFAFLSLNTPQAQQAPARPVFVADRVIFPGTALQGRGSEHRGAPAVIHPAGVEPAARRTERKPGMPMPIDPWEIPRPSPGNPTEPPPESPPGSPQPEVPPPVHEPGMPPRPDELPGKKPEEMRK